jgi:cytochrome c
MFGAGRSRLTIRRHSPAWRLAAAGALAAAVAPAFAENVGVQRGHAIAKANCARCHAIGTSGQSPNTYAPPFRLLGQRYPLSDLEEALAEGIVVGHEGADMPAFRLSTEQIAALLAYLGSIQRPR